MKKIVLVFSIGLMSLQAFAENAKYAGFVEIDKRVHERMFEQVPMKIATLSTFFYFPVDYMAFSNLLGTYVIDPNGEVEISNGDPNPFNLVLWQVLADNIARNVAMKCSQDPLYSEGVNHRPDLKPDFKKFVNQICQWPLPQAKSDEVLFGFFEQMTKYDFPYEEYEAWYEFVTTTPAKDGAEVVYNMTASILMNPHYLLKK